MDGIGEKRDGNGAEKRIGRPPKDIDPENTTPLFLPDGSVNPVVSTPYDDNQFPAGDDRQVEPGTVRGGDARDGAGLWSLEERMRACAELARSAESESVKLQANIKYSELEKQWQAARGETDIGAELAAVLVAVRDLPPGAVVQDL